MKRFKTPFALLLAMLLLAPAPFTGPVKSHPSDVIPDLSDFDWSLFFPDGDAVDWDDEDDIIYDGGELPEATIICSSKGWGRCYEWRTNMHLESILETPVIHESFGYFSGCFPTGLMEDRCRLIWHLLYTAIMSNVYGQTIH